MGIGFTELIIILVIIMIVFGIGRLSDLGKNIGKGVKDFKDAVRGKSEQDQNSKPDDSDPTTLN